MSCRFQLQVQVQKMLSIVLMFSMFLGLSSCGKNGAHTADSEGLKTFWGVYREGEAEGKIRAEHFRDGVLYCAEDVAGSASLYRREQTSTGEEKVFDFAGNVLDFVFLSDGRIVSVETPGAKAGTEDDSSCVSLCVYDTDGNLAGRAEVSILSDFLRARLRVLEQDAVILCLDQSVYRLNLDGGIVWKLEDLDFRIQDVSVSTSNNLILTQMTGSKKILHQVSPKGELTKTTATVSGTVQLPDAGQGIYAVDSGKLYEMDEKGNMRMLLNLSDNGIDGTKICCVEKLTAEIESYAFFLMEWTQEKNYEFVVLKENVAADETPKTERSVISLAVMNTNMFEVTVLPGFNQRSKKYRAVLKEYSDDYDIRKRQIEASLLSKDPPDLVEIGAHFSNEEYLNYVQKGVLRDISDLISKEQYPEFVLEDFTVDGKIYGLPSSFELETLICPTDVLEEKTSWNIDEFLTFLETYPDACTWQDYSADSIRMTLLNLCLLRGIYDFVDFESGEASLDGEAFRNMLQRIKNLRITPTGESMQERSLRGEAVLLDKGFYKSGNLRDLERDYGREFSLIGYPGERGQSGGLILYRSFLVINAGSSNQEGAEEMMLSYMQGGLQLGRYSFEFPVGKDAFEEYLQIGTEKTYMTDDDGNILYDENGEPIEYIPLLDGMPYPPVTEKQVEKLRNACAQAIYYQHQENTVKNIIYEECNPYLCGDISLESAVEKAQSRVQLLLSE